MATRKVYVTTTTKLIVELEEGKDINDVLNNMDYSFTLDDSDMEDATILDIEIMDWEVVDSK